MLVRLWTKLRRFEYLSDLTPKERHRLRIRAKTFRYACEFFGGLYLGKLVDATKCWVRWRRSRTPSASSMTWHRCKRC